ncbi:hypothetical protein DOY81_005003, partial [Sarcophaga bullata]
LDMKALKLNVTKLFPLVVILGTVAAIPLRYTGLDGRVYIIEPELKYNWLQAWHECARRDAELLAIDSEEENAVVIELLQLNVEERHNLWLGGNDEFSLRVNQDRPFIWSATGRRFTFTYWSDNNSPDNYNNHEHCVHIWVYSPLYQWNDAACNIEMGFICEENHYLQRYREILENECNTKENLQTEMLSNLERLHNETVAELQDKLQSIAQVGLKSKSEIQKLQQITQNGVQEIIDNCAACTREVKINGSTGAITCNLFDKPNVK